MHPPPGQTGCPEQGPGRAGRKIAICVCGYNCVFVSNSSAVCLQTFFPSLFAALSHCSLLQCTSSLLLSRLDTETSSIFICQNYQMSRHRCGHAVAQQALAKNRAAAGEAQLATRWHEILLKQWMPVWLWSAFDAGTYNCTLSTEPGSQFPRL